MKKYARFDELFNGYYKYGFSICCKILKNQLGEACVKQEDIEDILQDSFLKVYRAIHKISDGTFSVKTLVGATVRNTTLDALKSKGVIDRYFTDMSDEKIHNMTADQDEQPPNKICVAESVSELLAEIKKMDKIYSDIFLLKFHCNLSIRQIAEILNISDKTAYTRYERGRERLKLAIRQKEEL